MIGRRVWVPPSNTGTLMCVIANPEFHPIPSEEIEEFGGFGPTGWRVTFALHHGPEGDRPEWWGYWCLACRIESARSTSEYVATRWNAWADPDEGYGAAHRRLRQEFQDEVFDGCGVGWCMETTCLAPSRVILPTESWHLAHDHVNNRYLGPAHSTCNLLERHNRRAILGLPTS